MADIQSGDLIAALDEASLSRYHLRAVVASGVGFFTDAYDLFVTWPGGSCSRSARYPPPP